ncbi:MAG TPA: outer membrane beta-barrel protein [Candidatus Limnocylindria bacterium]|nr:outer membrane beta-barrel protein [Candidatus Limnocylindria bacterium]
MGLTLTGLVAAALPVAALEADDVLNYSWGRLTLKPQLDLTSVFTDNVFYGNNSILVPSPNSFTTQMATNVRNLEFSSTGVLTNGTPSGPISHATNIVARPEEQDVLMFISPGARFSYGYTDANHISLEYSFDKIFYLEHPGYDTDQQNILFKTSLAHAHWKLDGTDQIQFLSSFIGGGFFATTGEQINRRVWNDIYRFDYDISTKTYTYLSGVHYNQEYDKGLNVYNTDTMSAALGGGYRLSDLISVFVEGHYGQSALAPNLASQAKGPHSEFYGGYVGVKGDFTARLTGMVKAGYETRVFPDSPGASSTGASSPAVEVSLTYAPTLKSQITINYSRKTEISEQFGNQSTTVDLIGLSALQSIGTSGKWFVQLTGSYSVVDSSDLNGTFFYRSINTTGALITPTKAGTYPDGSILLIDGSEAPASTTGNLGRTDVQLSIGPTLVYQPRPWLQASLGYQFQHYSPSFRDALYASTHPLIPYDANEFTLRVAIGF